MNRASEIAVRWLLDLSGAEEDFIDGLVEALHEGCREGEADAIAARDEMLEHALRRSREEGVEDFIEACVKTHLGIEALERDEENLHHLTALAEIVAAAPASEPGRRASLAKAMAHVRCIRAA